MTEEIISYRIDQLEARVKGLESEIEEIEKQERKKLLWGISVLGSVVLALAGVIWNYRGVIFK